jgi:hypothetical protein
MKYIVEGQSAKLRQLYAKDARVWHSFDRRSKTFDEVIGLLERVAEKATRVSYDDLVLHLRDDGWVQEHVLTIEAANQAVTSIPAVIVVELDAEKKIRRLREYIGAQELDAMIVALDLR